MDLETVLTGLISGLVGGAGANILAERAKDARHAKAGVAKEDAQWTQLFSRYPRFMRELVADVADPKARDVRILFLKPTEGTSISSQELRLEYALSTHPDAKAAMAELVRIGYAVDVTPGNAPMYRLSDVFMERLWASAERLRS